MVKVWDLRGGEGWLVMSLECICEIKDVSSFPAEFILRAKNTYTVEG